MSKKDLILKIILPFAIILIGIILAIILIKVRSVPQRAARSFSGPLVEVMEVFKEKRQVVVPGTGTVQSTQVADITPQVSGQVRHISPQMVEGGFFSKGDLLFSIERIDYELALERARANLSQAELELMRNQSLAEIARLEWGRVQENEERKANPLTLYEPQMKAAEAQVASAKSAVRQAELDLSRTSIRAPFNCYIRNEMIDVGQYVRAGNKVATIAGTDEVEIVVPLPLEELTWLQIPGNGSKKEGSTVVVRIDLGPTTQEWSGRIARSLGEVDPRNRMAKVVVAVADPFGKQKESSGKRAELLPGMFVNVLMHGSDLIDVVVIPRGAVRDDDTVWTVDANNKLKIRPVDIVRRSREDVVIRTGLDSGEKVILTGLSAAADGMLLRPQLRETK